MTCATRGPLLKAPALHQVTKAQCFHEGGHAVVARVLGAEVIFLAVRGPKSPPFTLPHGQKPKEEGRCFFLYPAPPGAVTVLWNRTESIPPKIALLAISFGGLLAQKKVSKISVQKALLSGGQSDLAFVEELLRTINPKDHHSTLTQSLQLSHRLINRHWSAIEGIAGALQKTPILSGQEIEPMIAKDPGFKRSHQKP